jgi:hypothetical protein
MFDSTSDRESNILKAVEACRALIKTLCDPSISPLEREAGHILAQALRLQVEALGVLDNPDVKRFLEIEQTRPMVKVKRFPQDFQLRDDGAGLPASAGR